MHERGSKFSFPMSRVWIFVCWCYNSAGQLSVEGGSRSYSEAVGRPGILRPQPVPCVSVPSLCYPLRETDCSYQSYCQHQLCCLHCRPASSVPLEKFPLPLDRYSVPHAPEPGCSSPSSLQRRWSSDATAQTLMSQNSTLPESDAVKHATASDLQPRSSRERPTEQQIFQEKQLGDRREMECGEERPSAQTDEDTVSRRTGQRCARVHRALQHLHH